MCQRRHNTPNMVARKNCAIELPIDSVIRSAMLSQLLLLNSELLTGSGLLDKDLPAHKAGPAIGKLLETMTMPDWLSTRQQQTCLSLHGMASWRARISEQRAPTRLRCWRLCSSRSLATTVHRPCCSTAADLTTTSFNIDLRLSGFFNSTVTMSTPFRASRVPDIAGNVP